MTLEEKYTEVFKENIKLTMFYSALMNFLDREAKHLNLSTEIKYKIAENEKYMEIEKGFTDYSSE